MGILGRIIDEAQEVVGYGEEGMGHLGRVGGFVRDDVLSPAVGAVPDAVRGGVGTGLNVAMNVLDYPRGLVAGAIGTGDYWTAALRHKVGLEDDADWANIQEAYARGGGREVWEDEIIGEVDNPFVRGAIDIAIDPLTYAGVGLISKAGRGIANTGKIVNAVDDLSAGRRAIGTGLRGTGKAVEVAGEVMRAPDRYVFDPIVGKAAAGVGKVVKPVARPLVNNAIADRVKEKALTKISHLTQLTDQELLRSQVNRVWDSVDELLVGKQNANQALGLRQNLAEGSGVFAPTSSASSTTGVLPDAEHRARSIRNETTTNPVARAILDTEVEPGFRDNLRARLREMLQPKPLGIAAGAAAEVPEAKVFGLTNVRTSTGVSQRWDSVEMREQAGRYFAKMLVERAPLDAEWGTVRFAVDGLQRIKNEFMAEHGLTNATFSDVYRMARDIVEREDGLRLPSERYAGVYPGGGGFNDLAPEGVDNFAANTSAGIHTAGFRVDEAQQARFRETPEYQEAAEELADIIRNEGVAREFTTGGLFHGKGSFKKLEGDERMGRSGLRVLSRQEFYEEVQKEFGTLAVPNPDGSVDTSIMDELYDVGLERFRQEMVRAVAPSKELGGKGNPLAKSWRRSPDTDPRIVETSRDIRDPKTGKTSRYSTNRGLLMNQQEAERLIEKGGAGRFFYGDGVEDFRSFFDNDQDFQDAIDLLVVTSAHTKLDPNVTKAISLFREWKMDGADALRRVGVPEDDVQRFVAAHADSPTGQGITPQEGLPQHRTDAMALIGGEPIETQKLTSYRGSFMTELDLARNRSAYAPDLEDNATWNISDEDRQFLMEETDKSLRRSAGVVTNDMWNQIANRLQQGPEGNQYQILEAASRNLTDRLNAEHGTNYMPHELQAMVWAGVKGDFGNILSAEAGSDFSPMRLFIKKLFGEGDAHTNPYVRFGNEPGKATRAIPEDATPYTDTRGRKMHARYFTDVNDFLRRGGDDAILDMFQRASDTVATFFGEAAKRDRPVALVFDPNVEGGLNGLTTDGKPLRTRRKKSVNTAPSLRAPSATDVSVKYAGQGSVILEHIIPPGSPDKMAYDLFRLKFMVDPAMSLDWTRTRFVIDPTEDGMGMAVKIVHFPRSLDSAKSRSLAEGIPAAIETRRNRWMTSRGLTGSAVPTELQAEFARDILETSVRSDTLLKAATSKTKSAGNTRLLDDAVADAVDNQLMPQVADPEFGGGSFQIDPVAGLTPIETTPGRYTVSLTSAGEGGALPRTPGQKQGAAAKALIRENLEVLIGPDGDRITFGAFPIDDTTWSFDMNINVDDRQLAEDIGRITNQVSVFDNGIPYDDDLSFIPTGGNSDSPLKSAEAVREFLALVNEAEATGVRLMELWDESTLTRSRGSSGVVAGSGDTRFLKRRKGESRGEYLRRTLNVSTFEQGPILANDILDAFEASRAPVPEDALRDTDAYKSAVKLNMEELKPNRDGGYAFLSEETNNTLYGTTFEDGMSVGRYAEQTYDDLIQERELLERLGISWDAGASLESKLALTSRDDAKKIIKKWHKNGLSMENTTDPILAVRRLVGERMIAESGVESARSTFYSKAKAMWSELALASPRYVFANLTTNIADAIITGHFNFGAAGDVFEYAAKDLAGEPAERLLAGTKVAEVLNGKYGMGSDWTITQNTAKRMTETMAPRSQTRKALEKIGLGKVGVVVEGPRAFAQGIDINSRAGLFIDQMDSTFEAGRAELLGKLDAIAIAADVDMAGKDMLPSYDPAKIFKYYKDNGFNDGYARRAAREVAELRNTARRKAEAEVNRIALSYQKTNLDQMVGKVVPFHYWASRKLRFYAEEAYRNPILAANYARAVRGIDRAQNDPGMNARQRGFLALMSGPAGFTLLMNPDAVMGVIKATGLADSFTPDGQTEIGGIIQTLKQNGVGLYPWIDGALNMMGMYGDTFEPDMLGIRHRAIVGSVVNWMRGEGFFGDSNRDPGASPYTDLNLAAREKLSGWASLFLPDWMSQPVAVNAGGSAMQTSLDQVIESRIIAENPGMTNEQLVAVMNDPESPEYQSAYQDVSRAGVIQQLLSFTAPVSFRVEENTRDVRTAKREMIRNEAEEKNIEPWELTDSLADNEFRAEYLRMTGEEFDANDWQDTSLELDLMRATPDARMFVLRENEYQAIGGKEGREITSTYYAILNGEQNPPGYRGNIREQSPEMREWLANRWLDNTGSRQIFETIQAAQRSYRQKHPEFNQFKTWQSQMFQLQALHGGSLAEYRRQASRQNPAAAQYFADQERWLASQGVAPEDMAAELDRVTTNSNAWFAINGRPKTIYDPVKSQGAGDPQADIMAPYANTQYNPPSPPMPAGATPIPQVNTGLWQGNQYIAEQSGVDWVDALNYRR